MLTCGFHAKIGSALPAHVVDFVALGRLVEGAAGLPDPAGGPFDPQGSYKALGCPWHCDGYGTVRASPAPSLAPVNTLAAKVGTTVLDHFLSS